MLTFYRVPHPPSIVLLFYAQYMPRYVLRIRAALLCAVHAALRAAQRRCVHTATATAHHIVYMKVTMLSMELFSR